MITLSGYIVDIIRRRVFPGILHIDEGTIAEIEETEECEERYLLPGFIDAHIHIESSLLAPSEFARLAVVHGTVATVSDPHEIANVLGVDGVRFMIENSRQVPFHFFFGAPSCVPATAFETAGASITPDDVRQLLESDGLFYLSEMMNYPGVINGDPEVLKKIAIAHALGKTVDGHAPGLRRTPLRRYIAAGINTDHECYSLDEALEKISYGMKILIREGSAAKNFNALHTLLKSHPEEVMFCNDDKHPDDLIKGHIDELVRRAIALGYDLYDVLRAASWNPSQHYRLGVGMLQKGDAADFIAVDNLTDFKVLATYIAGKLVASAGKSLIQSVPITPINQFNCPPVDFKGLRLKAGGENIHVIEALPGELITNKLALPAAISLGFYVTDPSRDILKLVVVNRYRPAAPAVAFIRGFALELGALASSISHDSHNIIAVGVDDEALAQAINAIIAAKGGVAAVTADDTTLLPLPIAGLMSDRNGYDVAAEYAELKKRALSLSHGKSKLKDPFMTLSFMALLVIPTLKLSDLGLFDGSTFSFLPLEATIPSSTPDNSQ